MYGRSRPTHAVSEGLLALAEDKTPEGTILIGLSEYALRHHTSLILRGRRVIITVGRVLVGRRLNLSSNSEYPNEGAAFNSQKLSKHIAIKHCLDYMSADVPNTEPLWEAKCPS